MKELSIEEKAQRYDEAVNKLKIMHDDWSKTQNRAAKEVEEIFPEFAESKEDKIKNIIKRALKSYFKGNLSSGTNDVDYAACLSWLKKQGEQIPAWSEEDEMIYQHCLVILHDYGYDNWLKSFYLQNTWKPSDEQIDILDEYIYITHPSEKYAKVLISLLDDLMKLKE